MCMSSPTSRHEFRACSVGLPNSKFLRKLFRRGYNYRRLRAARARELRICSAARRRLPGHMHMHACMQGTVCSFSLLSFKVSLAIFKLISCITSDVDRYPVPGPRIGTDSGTVGDRLTAYTCSSDSAAEASAAVTKAGPCAGIGSGMQAVSRNCDAANAAAFEFELSLTSWCWLRAWAVAIGNCSTDSTEGIPSRARVPAPLAAAVPRRPVPRRPPLATWGDMRPDPDPAAG